MNAANDVHNLTRKKQLHHGFCIAILVSGVGLPGPIRPIYIDSNSFKTKTRKRTSVSILYSYVLQLVLKESLHH
jgi:hypothetical protein